MTDEHDAFLLGVQQFNNGQFFECHDTWEEIWMEKRGEEKKFLQGLIQIAVGYSHASNGTFHAALSQLSKGADKLSGIPTHFFGIDADHILRVAQDHARMCEDIIIEHASVSAFTERPTIHLV